MREDLISTTDSLRVLSGRKAELENVEAQLQAATVEHQKQQAELEQTLSALATAKEQLKDVKAQIATLRRQFSQADA
jgi:hypothetical protein